ncbi:MAG: tryptophan--tRNA ligase [Candidatus Nomurabacteria bacterium]|jgi:tryptophanyl-tRNA synthetase|nr:tryptophan--tRNA ligase [Candidatus Nomurabacteria bacterium]
MKDVILTGVRANEEPTLGNYLGAYVPMVELSNRHAATHQINMFVPDLHSFTTPIDHATLYENILRGVKYYLAAGLDIERDNIDVYRQSFIPAHSEMTWILDCFTYFGEMSRMTQFKDKSAGQTDSITVGLFNYPVLMAADILLYDAKYVPLGEDQFQHLEITRDIALRMNNKFGQELFTVPAPTAEQSKFMGRDKGLRIRSLTDPTKKMSKSDPSENAKILLSDDPDTAVKKILSATTDSVGVINFDFENQPGMSSLLQILALLSGKSQAEVNKEWVGKTRYGDFKKVVADEVYMFLTDFQNRVAAISDDYVLKALAKSEAKMNKIAERKLYKVQTAVGLRRA